MAHLSAPKPPHPELPVLYNLDGVVGASPATNSREDVMFVQFAFKVIADSPRPTTSPDVLKAAKTVRVTGRMDNNTITAIRTLQANSKKATGNFSKVVDGRVSPVRGGYSYGGGALWTICNLNNSLQDRYWKFWPRIDNIPGCPQELKTMVKRQVAGTM